MQSITDFAAPSVDIVDDDEKALPLDVEPAPFPLMRSPSDSLAIPKESEKSIFGISSDAEFGSPLLTQSHSVKAPQYRMKQHLPFMLSPRIGAFGVFTGKYGADYVE